MTGYHNTFLGKLLEEHEGIELTPRFELVEQNTEPRQSWEEIAEEIGRIRQEQGHAVEEAYTPEPGQV